MDDDGKWLPLVQAHDQDDDPCEEEEVEIDTRTDSSAAEFVIPLAQIRPSGSSRKGIFCKGERVSTCSTRASNEFNSTATTKA